MSRPTPERRPVALAAPLAPAAIAFASGVVADRLGFAPATTSAAAVAMVAAGVAVLGSRARIGSVAVLVAFVALGAAWHHRRWSDLAADDLSRGDWSVPRPAWLRGVLAEVPEFRPSDRPDDSGRTLSAMKISAIYDQSRWRPASGRIFVSVVGDRSDLRAGDPVFVAGSLGAIPAPMNPGEPDRRDRARAEGVRLRISVGEAIGLWPDPEGRPSWGLRLLGGLREASRKALVSGLPEEVAPLASALLLGRREGVDPDDNDAFARTGTTHLLAISGLHLQAMAVALLTACAALRLGRKKSQVLVAVVTIGYAVLVGLLPSVVRSATMTVVVCLAALCDRCSRPANLLAAAALATLALNPAHLFDAGCQLSFLGVAALVWAVDPVLALLRLKPPADDRGPQAGPEDPVAALDALERRLEPGWKKALRRSAALAAQGVTISAVVWLVGLPITALRFHLASPIGIILNVPLIPMTTAALICAALALIAGAIWPPLALPFAWGCSALLKGTLAIVRWGADLPGGHAFVPGPAVGWVAAIYAALGLALWMTWRRRGGRRWAWAAVGVVSLGAAGSMIVPSLPETFEAEVLAVNHGLCVLLRAEDGRTSLYDCGSMRDPRVGRRVIAPALWSRGVRRIDSVLLSHADSDHFNALPDLLDRIPIGEVRIPPGFGGSANPEAVRLLDLLRARRVPVVPISAGDRVDLGGGASAEAIHPPPGWLPGSPDNARSLVLDVRDRSGRRFLLTGDLDGPGLSELVARPKIPIDAMLSPHHGGRTANPGWLFAWAEPKRVIVSQPRPKAGSRDTLDAVASRGAIVDRTWLRGAILVRFLPGGLAVGGFLDPPPAAPAPPAMAVPIVPTAVVVVLGLVGGLVLCLALVVIEWGAWTLVMPGRRLAGTEAEPPPWEPIEATAADGTHLSGAWLGSRTPGARSAVLLHGFGEDRSSMRDRAEALSARGLNVAVIDARGRGRSLGHFTSFGGMETDDLLAWLDALSDRVGPDPRLLVWGRSMGAAIAVRAATLDPRIGALVLEAPYADLRAAVAGWLRRMRLPGLFAGAILARAEVLAGVSLHEPRPIDLAPKLSIPTLILHGTADPIVRLANARRLASAFAGPVELVEIPGARHHDVFTHGGEALADRALMLLDGPGPGASDAP